MADAPLVMNPFVDIHVHPQPETSPIDPARRPLGDRLHRRSTDLDFECISTFQGCLDALTRAPATGGAARSGADRGCSRRRH
jgi:hypothetical protein